MSYFQSVFNSTPIPSPHNASGEQQIMEEVAQEGGIIPVYASLQFHLLHSLRPIKKQRLLEVMQKKDKMKAKVVKAQINLRRVTKFESENIQQQIAQVATQKQQNVLQQQSRYKQSNYQNHSRKKLQQSKQQYSIVQKENRSDKIDSYLQKATDLNREVMMRLLSIVQQQKKEKSSSNILGLSQYNSNLLESMHNRSHFERDNPIVINNIMKSPVDHITKEMYEKQMRIKILESQRATRNNNSALQTQTIKTNKMSNKKLNQFLFEEMTIDLNNQPHTHRSDANHISPKLFSRKNRCFISLRNSRIETQSELKQTPKQIKQNIEAQTSNKQQQSLEKQSQEINLMKKKKRERFIDISKKVKIPQVSQQQNVKRQQQKQISKNQKDLQPHQTSIVYKKPVLMQISLNEQQQPNQKLSLAQAFKKRMGKLQSQKNATKGQVQKKEVKKIISSYNTQPNNLHQMTQSVNGNEQTQSLVVHKTRKIAKKQIPVKSESQKTLKEPPKQLLDRLIFGTKAKMSKQQMYALTKKNYQNLPEIKAKVQEQNRKKKQQERLEKIKLSKKQGRSVKTVKKLE